MNIKYFVCCTSFEYLLGFFWFQVVLNRVSHRELLYKLDNHCVYSNVSSYTQAISQILALVFFVKLIECILI